MGRGDFEAAWRQTDALELQRRAGERAGTWIPDPDQLLWNGDSFAGRRVLVRCRHGLGDTLQFVRFLPAIVRQAQTLTVLVQPHLLAVLRGGAAFGDVRDGCSDAAAPEHDVVIEVMELAYALRVTVPTIPRVAPYLPVERIQAAARRLPELDAAPHPRVGLLWGAGEWDPARSIPLEALAPLERLGRRGDVRFFSLQQGPQAARWTAASFPLQSLSQHTQSVLQLAAAMLQMDVIITVDGMPAHLAGALGRPVLLLLPHSADWRWMDQGDESPWYPTLRLVRQNASGDWFNVGIRAARRLEACLKAGRL